jgi:hypothetical protein
MPFRFFTIFSLLIISFAHGFAQETKPKTTPTSQTFTAEGISIEFSATPVRNTDGTDLRAGEEATVKFKILGTNGGVPLSNLRPVAWVDQRRFGG